MRPTQNYVMAMLMLACAVMPVRAQVLVDGASEAVAPQFSPDSLDQMLRPIALYPDPLLAEVFTAATLPAQIVLADRYLTSGGDPGQIEQQAWDPSLQALAHYPAVLKWLDDNLPWTTELGVAFANQQQDVMDAVQRLRAEAQAAGNLRNTPQENVVSDDGTVEILPADPNLIYVPYYPFDTIYADPGVYCSFGIGFPLGGWLRHDWDWRHHQIIFWGHGQPRPPDWWRRGPRDRVPPRGAPVWRAPASSVVAGRHGPDRGWGTQAFRAAPALRPAIPAPVEVNRPRAGSPEARPPATFRAPVETRPPVESRPTQVSRPAPAPRQQTESSAFGGPQSSFEARQSSARGSESRATTSAPPASSRPAASAPASRPSSSGSSSSGSSGSSGSSRKR